MYVLTCDYDTEFMTVPVYVMAFRHKPSVEEVLEAVKREDSIRDRLFFTEKHAEELLQKGVVRPRMSFYNLDEVR